MCAFSLRPELCQYAGFQDQNPSDWQGYGKPSKPQGSQKIAEPNWWSGSGFGKRTYGLNQFEYKIGTNPSYIGLSLLSIIL
jgi:hypothetical protein